MTYSKTAWLNLQRLEIDITYVCGHNCVDCNRITGLAPTGPEMDMTVEQVRCAFSESEWLGHKWQRIAIMGGEPTLHPRFHEIVGEAVAYKNRANPSVGLLVTSRGVGQRVEQEIGWLRKTWPCVEINDTQKRKTDGLALGHIAVGLAPCDRPSWPSEHHCRGCYISGKCGLGLTYAGFYPCNPAAAIDRVFGRDWGIKSLDQASPESLEAILQEACPLCGCYAGAEPVVWSQSAPQLSPCWMRALERYTIDGPPRLTRYGQTLF